MNINLGELIRLKNRLVDIDDNISTTLSSANAEVNNISSLLSSSGLSNACSIVEEEISVLVYTLKTNLEKIEEFMSTQINKYEITNEEAVKELKELINLLNSLSSDKNIYGNDSQFVAGGLKNINTNAALGEITAVGVGGIVGESMLTGSKFEQGNAFQNNNANNQIDISVYNNKPEYGFVVTTGNKTYNLTPEEYDLLCSIVAAESDHSYDDALGVVTTILNRCEDPNWINFVEIGYHMENNPINQATCPHQFVVYQHGLNQRFLNGNAPESVQKAVMDALAGVRNHDYLSFRSNDSTGYSWNMITDTGNRYL